MAIEVLIVTPSVGFGELIRQSLEEEGEYQVVLAVSGEEAVEHAQTGTFTLCILDADITDISTVELWRRLDATQSDLRLILIPPDKERDSDALDALPHEGLLNKPFYMPNLLATVEAVLSKTTKEVPEERHPPPQLNEVGSSDEHDADRPLALQDVGLVAQHLTRLTLESAAQAALITHDHELFAYAGELPQPAAEELANAVAGFWATDGGSDLARFVRLDATGGEYMLYATSLGGDLVLSLVFDAQMPFSEIRAQAGRLARSLAGSQTQAQERARQTSQDAQAGSAAEDPTGELPVEPLLANVPSPSPSARPTGQGSDVPSRPIADQRSVDPHPEVSVDPPDAAHERSPVEPPRRLDSPDLDQKAVSSPDVAPAPASDPGSWELEYPSEAQVGEQVSPKRELMEPIALEPASPALHRITYACVLIPRMPQHYLTGDLSARLSALMNQVCLAFSWRLENMTIRPEYMQWIVSVTPEESPSRMIAKIRMLTSQSIFEESARFARENPSGDFWAAGYLLISRSQPLGVSDIQEFIRRTRTWQGARGKP